MTAIAQMQRQQKSQKGGLGAQLLAHIQAQIESARRLLDVVLEQKAAIRARDVHGVVRLAGVLRGEIGRLELIDGQRAQLLKQSGDQLQLAPGQVTLTAIGELFDAEQSDRAQADSAELRGLLHELQREHAANQALMQVELGFLDHLMRMLSLDSDSGGYGPRGTARPARPPRARGELRVLDLRA